MRARQTVTYDAVVLAGRYNTGRLKDVSDARLEAMIDVAGQPMVGRVLRSLRASRVVGQIALVGPEEELRPVLGPGTTVVAAGTDVLDNARRGMGALASPAVLICTSDLPLLTGDAVRDFVDRCHAAGAADLYVPILAAEDAEARFPGMKRTYGRIREGRYTGGNIFLVRTGLPDAVWARAAEFVANRKSVIKLAGLLGPVYILKLLVFRPTVAELERRVETLLGISCRAVRTPYVEIGVDCDKPSDLALVRKVLGA